MKVDYQKTFIYKLCCKDINIKDIYVGHTTDYKSRNQDHKNSCNNPNSKKYNEYKYQFIRENGGYENFYMIKIKDFPCTEKRAAEAEENRIMIELSATLNSKKSYRSEEEKKEYDKEYYKNYYQQNKDELNEKQKNYYQQNKDNILEQQKEYKKDYYEQNKEIIKEKSKNYREDNKHIINEKVICDKCGTTITKNSLKRHQKTDKCKRLSVCMILDDD